MSLALGGDGNAHTQTSQRSMLRSPVEASQSILHCYRHLLREAAYCPDPVVRRYLKQEVAQRFRDRSLLRNSTTNPTLFLSRQNLHLREGWKQLRLLAQGNHGDSKRLLRVLKLAYGRIGVRKYRLLKPFLDPNLPAGEGSTQMAILCARKRPNVLSLVKSKTGEHELDLPPAVMAILTKQHAREFARRVTDLRSLKPEVPERNAWGLPMPLSRIKNRMRGARKSLIDKILPPLPLHDYGCLQGYALGTQPINPPPKRRGNTIRRILNQQLPAGGLTERKMRRAYRVIYFLSPTCQYNPETGKWEVQWAEPDKGGRHAHSARAGDDFLFK